MSTERCKNCGNIIPSGVNITAGGIISGILRGFDHFCCNKCKDEYLDRKNAKEDRDNTGESKGSKKENGCGGNGCGCLILIIVAVIIGLVIADTEESKSKDSGNTPATEQIQK